jgi:hypothetical protein
MMAATDPSQIYKEHPPADGTGDGFEDEVGAAQAQEEYASFYAGEGAAPVGTAEMGAAADTGAVADEYVDLEDVDGDHEEL